MGLDVFQPGFLGDRLEGFVPVPVPVIGGAAVVLIVLSMPLLAACYRAVARRLWPEPSPELRSLLRLVASARLSPGGDRPDGVVLVQTLLPPEEYARWVEACVRRYQEVLTAHVRQHASKGASV